MSHFTHVCSCGHDRENHIPVGDKPCQTSGIIDCGCRGAHFDPAPILRETFIPAWVDQHRMGEHRVTPVLAPGTRINLGSGGTPSCSCEACVGAFEAAS